MSATFINVRKEAYAEDAHGVLRKTYVEGLIKLEDIIKIEQNPKGSGTIVTIQTPTENLKVYITESFLHFVEHVRNVGGDQVTGDLLNMSKYLNTTSSETEHIAYHFDGADAETFLSDMFSKEGLSWEDATDREGLDKLEDEYYPEDKWPNPSCAKGKEKEHFEEFKAKAEAWFENYLKNKQS